MKVTTETFLMHCIDLKSNATSFDQLRLNYNHTLRDLSLTLKISRTRRQAFKSI